MAIPCPGEPFVPERPKVLLVEGDDEWHLLISALPEWGLTGVDVRRYGGGDQTKLAEALSDAKLATGFGDVTCVGVTRDAEGDAAAALETVKGALLQAGLPVPDKDQRFVDGHDQLPRVGVFIIPDGSSPGCLEGMCLAAASPDPALECVERYHACLAALVGKESTELQLHANEAKIKLYAFLASRQKPGLRIGQAWKAGVWDKGHSVWQPLRDFVAQM